jgi:hypothetical protein
LLESGFETAFAVAAGLRQLHYAAGEGAQFQRLAMRSEPVGAER